MSFHFLNAEKVSSSFPSRLNLFLIVFLIPLELHLKKGLILSESLQIIDLIKNQLNNNDYLMIKGSNSTGLNKFTKELKKNVI